jgi:hypothetical protein
MWYPPGKPPTEGGYFINHRVLQKDLSMKDFKTVSVRLSEYEATSIEKMARDKELTVSELVRIWLEQAAQKASGLARNHT